MQTHPFLGTHSDLLIHALPHQLFHNVKILYSKHITGPHYGACVVKLVNIFGNHSKMTGTLLQYLGEDLPAPVG